MKQYNCSDNLRLWNKLGKLFFKSEVVSEHLLELIRCNRCCLVFFSPFPPLLSLLCLLFSSLLAIFFLVHPFPTCRVLSYLDFTVLSLDDVVLPAPLICLNELHCKGSTCLLQLWFESTGPVWDPLSFSIAGSKYFKDMLLSSCGLLSLMTGQQAFPSTFQSVGSWTLFMNCLASALMKVIQE